MVVIMIIFHLQIKTVLWVRRWCTYTNSWRVGINIDVFDVIHCWISIYPTECIATGATKKI